MRPYKRRGHVRGGVGCYQPKRFRSGRTAMRRYGRAAQMSVVGATDRSPGYT